MIGESLSVEEVGEIFVGFMKEERARALNSEDPGARGLGVK